MVLLAIFIMMRWIAQVEAAYNRITLKFTDNDDGVEYDAIKKVVKASGHISNCISFNEANTAIIDKNTVTIDCSSRVFSIIDKMIDEENITEWEEIAREINLNIICELLRGFECLLYDIDVRDVIHKRLVEHILPGIVFSVTNEEQRGAYIECSNEYIKEGIKNQIKLILPLYLQRYSLGLLKEEDMTVIYKDAENKNQKEILESIRSGELRILPEVLNNDMTEDMNIDKKQMLGVLLWMFDIYFGISTLDLSGHILMDGLMGQLSAMKHLKVLNLRGCSVKLRNDCDWIGTGFKALKDLDISGVKIEEAFSGIFCGITGLKKLNMEKCFIKPESRLEFIKEQKDLEELRIGGNYLSEEYLNIIFSHENIRVLDMDCCTVDDMYIYGGKIESTDILKVLNGGKFYIGEGEMRIILSETDEECCLKGWKTYNSRLMFFGDDGEMKVNLSIDKMDGTGSDALESRTKTWRLSELNGSQVFVEGNKEIRIVLLQTSSILDELKEFTRGELYFTGKDNGKMNFLDVMKGKGFMKRVKEYNCGQVYFADKQMEVILSYDGLKKLNMRQCGLESEAIMKIKDKSTLMELDLSDNNMISENDMIHIIKECPNLKKLNMNKCRMLVTGDFKEIPILEKLEELNIGGSTLSGDCYNFIFKHKKLLKLSFEGCGFTEDDLIGINKLKMLKELHVGNNFISIDNSSRIFKLKELEVLNMSKNRQFIKGYKREINIGGIKALSKLKILDLSSNDICGNDIDEIFELSKLKELKMERCEFISEKLKNICKLRDLEKLSIAGNKISENDMEGITSLRKLKELDMAESKIWGVRAFDNIGMLNDSLKLLSIKDCSISEEVKVQRIAELTNLQELRLIDNMFPWILCGILRSLPLLRVLHVGTVDVENFIGYDKLPYGTLSKLEILDLGCFKVNNEFIKDLSKLVNLKELSLTCERDYDAQNVVSLHISVFPSNLRKLKVAGMGHYSLDLQCSKNQDIGMIFENLEDLELLYVESISEDIISAIKRCTKLRKFGLQMDFSNFVKHDLKGIEDIFTLEEIILVSVNLNGEDIIRFSRLKQLRRLKLLYFDMNKDHINEIEMLKSLEVLGIQNNSISYSMNGIFKLKNFREFIAGNVSSDHDKRGEFDLVKDFEKFEYNSWDVNTNNNCIEARGNDGVVEMKKEATLNN
ncbi:hypothetical protein PAEPH01_0821 [Pancytospora epiphaga]|nr:hypothetical protein PAEPH01_0821 [Pancytospora epiphaga]